MDKLFVNFLPPWVETNIQPAFYDKESGSVLQQTARMYAKVNCLVRMFNKLSKETKETVDEYIAKFVELKDFVDTYFENLDVQEEINNKLDAMVEDGTLKTLLTEILTIPRSNDIEIERLGRIIDPTFNLDSTINGYFGMQGGTLVDENTFVMATNHYSTMSAYADELCKLRKFNINTGEIITQTNVSLGHANNMTYDKTAHRYYVTPAHGNVNSSLYSNKIIVLDDNFNILQSIDTEINFDSISVDENGVLYAGVTYKGDLSNACKVFKLNKSDFSVAETITLSMPIPNSIGVGQDMCVSDGYIYFLQHSPSAVYVFDMDGTNVINYNLKNDPINTLGEVESINSLGNGKFVIATSYQPAGNLYALEQFFVIDVLHNIPKTTSTRLLNIMNSPLTQTIVHVSPSNSVYAPDGSEAKPYYCIDEVTSLGIRNHITITLDDTANYPVARINSSDIEIVRKGPDVSPSLVCGDGYKAIATNNSKIYLNYVTNIPALNCERGSNVYVYHCNFVDSGAGHLVSCNGGSEVTLEAITSSVTADLTDYLFINNHGIISWKKGNCQKTTTGYGSITKWFSGKINFIEPFAWFSGIMDATESINNGNIEPFTNIDIRFNDLEETLVPARNQDFQKLMCNLSTAGTGNNVFRQTTVHIDNGVISLSKKNQISFNAQGNMTVNTSPTINIFNIYLQ